MKDGYVKVCPRCGSTDITPEGAEGGVWNACNECGLGKMTEPSSVGSPPILEIKKSELEAFRKRIKKKPLTK